MRHTKHTVAFLLIAAIVAAVFPALRHAAAQRAAPQNTQSESAPADADPDLIIFLRRALRAEQAGDFREAMNFYAAARALKPTDEDAGAGLVRISRALAGERTEPPRDVDEPDRPEPPREQPPRRPAPREGGADQEIHRLSRSVSSIEDRLRRLERSLSDDGRAESLIERLEREVARLQSNLNRLERDVRRLDRRIR